MCIWQSRSIFFTLPHACNALRRSTVSIRKVRSFSFCLYMHHIWTHSRMSSPHASSNTFTISNAFPPCPLNPLYFSCLFLSFRHRTCEFQVHTSSFALLCKSKSVQNQYKTKLIRPIQSMRKRNMILPMSEVYFFIIVFESVRGKMSESTTIEFVQKQFLMPLLLWVNNVPLFAQISK